ncbi:MAG: glycosyltransferase family 2 protein [Treponema sp.]|nr:glycosyltransferase family 2 protein [Treponema sp.]
MKSLVSIIIPIYNAEYFLDRCLNSVIQQTYTNLEIILINDGSTDASLAICTTYAQKDSRIILINKTNEGVSIARNMGIQQSSGDYIAFLDADDWIASNYIEQLMLPFKNNSIDISICGYQICHKYTPTYDKSEYSFNFTAAKKYLLENQKKGNFSVIVPWGKILRKRIITGIFFPENLHFEDEATIYKFFYNSNQVAECDYKAYYYFQSPNGLTKATNLKYPEDAIKVFEMQYAFFKEKKDVAFYQQTLATLLWKCLTLYIEKKDKRAFAKNKIEIYLKDFNHFNSNYRHTTLLNFFCHFPFIYLLYKKIF